MRLVFYFNSIVHLIIVHLKIKTICLSQWVYAHARGISHGVFFVKICFERKCAVLVIFNILVQRWKIYEPCHIHCIREYRLIIYLSMDALLLFLSIFYKRFLLRFRQGGLYLVRLRIQTLRLFFSGSLNIASSNLVLHIWCKIRLAEWLRSL